MKGPKVPITSQDVDLARRAQIWDLANAILYRLCAQYPLHQRQEEIIAKVWLIGRSYAAGIERTKRTDDRGDIFFTRDVAPLLRSSDSDSWLQALPNRDADFLDNRRAVVEVHARLLRQLARVLNRKARSFVSKYLHFHRPNLFLIYDSRAASAIRSVTPDTRFVDHLAARPADCDYRDFCARSAWVIARVRRDFGARLTPRQLDNLLLEAYRTKTKSLG